jgi:hypothetical protein
MISRHVSQGSKPFRTTDPSGSQGPEPRSRTTASDLNQSLKAYRQVGKQGPKNPQIQKYLKQLVKKGLFGRPHVKAYLYDLKRRNCRPNTIRSNFSAITVFLSYLKEIGRTYLETITRDDLSGFIEHEQDRGMQPNTVFSRVRLLYAFLRYLVDREVVHPDLLNWSQKSSSG